MNAMIDVFPYKYEADQIGVKGEGSLELTILPGIRKKQMLVTASSHAISADFLAGVTLGFVETADGYYYPTVGISIGPALGGSLNSSYIDITMEDHAKVNPAPMPYFMSTWLAGQSSNRFFVGSMSDTSLTDIINPFRSESWYRL